MTVEVTVRTVEPTPTAVVLATTTWTEFPRTWGPMLNVVSSGDFAVDVFWSPNVP